MHHLVTNTLHKSPTNKIDVVVGLDARGFLLGPIIALRLGAAFVPVRKAGKLPGKCIKVEYEKEYGSDFFEVRREERYWLKSFPLICSAQTDARGCHQAWPDMHRC